MKPKAAGSRAEGFLRWHRARIYVLLWWALVNSVGAAACSPQTPRLPALAPGAVILAFGDSLTYGTGAAKAQSYPAVLERLLRRRVINAGVPGELSGEGVQRLPPLLDRYRPDLLILCHGGNDLLRRYDEEKTATNIRSMVNEARRRDIPVALIGVPRPSLLFMDTAPLYAEIAAEFGLPYEGEILTRLESNAALKSDQIHPNAGGYQALAEAVRALLRKSQAI
jgi:acyl-CoA thioesterase-1